jgi:cytochrome c556|tara:strand:- start:140 stop:577 length:438 start_codon:yes stop_codon:yes gene_type:complete
MDMGKRIVAVFGVVVVASLVGLAQSGGISSVEDYDAAMKEVGATFRAVQSDLDARDGESVVAGTRKLTELFGRVQAFWEANGVANAAGIAAQAGEAASAITSAVETQAFQDIAPARETLGGTCQACHGEYRERVDGDSHIKPGVL